LEEGDLKSRTIVGLYAATLAGECVWLGGIIAAPYLRSRGSGWAAFLYACFAPICHQRPDRSFQAFGYPLAVCARCSGIYLGAFLGLLVYPFRRGFEVLKLPKIATLALVSTPIAIDAAGNLLGFWNSGQVFRLATGLFWGSILPFYFLTGVGELLTAARKK
jgi:uncharacterized membrane protein